jgi:hypothetical protein
MAILALFRKFAAKTQHDYVQRVKMLRRVPWARVSCAPFQTLGDQ